MYGQEILSDILQAPELAQNSWPPFKHINWLF